RAAACSERHAPSLLGALPISEMSHRAGRRGRRRIGGAVLAFSGGGAHARVRHGTAPPFRAAFRRFPGKGGTNAAGPRGRRCRRPDRKSTRLNSSHVKISYAVF